MNMPTEWGKDQQEQAQIVAALLLTIEHFFGGWSEICKKVQDGRNRELITYPLEALFFTGMLMYICHLGSRRNITYQLRGNEAAAEKMKQLFGTEEIAHGDTLECAFRKLKLEEVQQMVSWMTARLIRNKVLAKWRLFDYYYLVAINGTCVLRFSERHCPYCLTQKLKNGSTRYYHPVLEAKLITENGFAFSFFQLMAKGNLFQTAFPNGVGSLKNIAFPFWKPGEICASMFVISITSTTGVSKSAWTSLDLYDRSMPAS